MTCGCGGNTYCRGVCRRCYRVYLGAVLNGETTWQRLESAGLAKSGRPLAPARLALAKAGKQ
jgi:hypothetical protein